MTCEKNLIFFFPEIEDQQKEEENTSNENPSEENKEEGENNGQD